MNAIICVVLGSSCGALLRWKLGLMFNTLIPTLPLGTFFANALGGFLIGIASGFFSLMPLSSEVRLLVITGFLGGLTTFSSFTAEVGTLIQEQKMLAAGGLFLLHVLGSFAMFFLGIKTVSLFRALS